MEFLRDANVTDNKGQIAYDQWVIGGKSAPAVMDSSMIDITIDEPIEGDVNGDGVVNITDLLIMISQWGQCPTSGDCTADVNGDGWVNVTDLLVAIANWG
jgi:hypothetical protein